MKRKQNNNALLKKVFVPAALLLSGSVTSNANNMTNTAISSNSAILPVHNMNMTNSAILPTSEKTSADFSSYLASSTPYANKIIDIFESSRHYHNLSPEERQFHFQEGKDIFFEDLLSGKLKKSFLDVQRRRMDFITTRFSFKNIVGLLTVDGAYNHMVQQVIEYDMLEYTKFLQMLDAFQYLYDTNLPSWWVENIYKTDVENLKIKLSDYIDKRYKYVNYIFNPEGDNRIPTMNIIGKIYGKTVRKYTEKPSEWLIFMQNVNMLFSLTDQIGEQLFDLFIENLTSQYNQLKRKRELEVTKNEVEDLLSETVELLNSETLTDNKIEELTEIKRELEVMKKDIEEGLPSYFWL